MFLYLYSNIRYLRGSYSRQILRLYAGKLHFVKFETVKVDECINFIEAKGLHRRNGSAAPMRVKATGGGAYKFADVRCHFIHVFFLIDGSFCFHTY